MLKILSYKTHSISLWCFDWLLGPIYRLSQPSRVTHLTADLPWASQHFHEFPYKTRRTVLACENIRFSSLFAAGDVSRGGTSATQWQKFHTDDANQCLHNKSGSHGVPNTNLYSFTCLLVDFGKFLCSSANELQQSSNSSSREEYIQQILTVLLEILSFVLTTTR